MPGAEARFQPIPESLKEAKDLKTLGAQLADFLVRARGLNLFFSPSQKVYPAPGETERNFTTRLGMFMGRRSIRAASTAMSKYRMSQGAGRGAEAAAEDVNALRQDIAGLEEELRRETESIGARWDEAGGKLETVSVKAESGDIEVDTVALAWTPLWRVAYKDKAGIERTATVPASR